jgi:hypothetical protein
MNWLPALALFQKVSPAPSMGKEVVDDLVSISVMYGIG